MNSGTTLNPESLRDILSTLIKSEIAKYYALFVKNIRYVLLGAFAFFAFCAAVYAGICMFVLGIMLNTGASPVSLGGAAIVLGAVILVGVAAFIGIIFYQKLWVRLFKIDEMVEKARNRESTFTPMTPSPQT